MASIRKRSWTSPSGEKKTAYQLKYKLPSGALTTETFQKKKEAEARLTIIQSEILNGTHVAKKDTITVAQLCAEYLTHCADRVKDGRITASTEQAFEIMARTCVVPFMGGKMISEVEPYDIEQLFQWILKNRRMAPYTAKKRLKLLGTIWEYAVKRKYTRERPVTEALKDFAMVQPTKIETFTVDQVQALIAAARTRDGATSRKGHAMKQAFLHVALFCGLRVGEICALKIENVIFDTRTILVRHSLNTKNGLKSTKTRNGLREVPMPAHVAELLRMYVENFYDPNPSNLIFTTARLGMVFPPNIWIDLWQPLLAKAGLAKGYHFHALRHFYTSWALDNGLSAADLVKMVGHGSFDTTLRVYTHSVRDDDRRRIEMDRISALLLAPTEYQRQGSDINGQVIDG